MGRLTLSGAGNRGQRGRSRRGQDRLAASTGPAPARNRGKLGGTVSPDEVARQDMGESQPAEPVTDALGGVHR